MEAKVKRNFIKNRIHLLITFGAVEGKGVALGCGGSCGGGVVIG